MYKTLVTILGFYINVILVQVSFIVKQYGGLVNLCDIVNWYKGTF